MSPEELKHTLEAALLAAGRALRLEDLELLFEDDAPPRGELRAALAALARDWKGRSLELVEVAGVSSITRSGLTRLFVRRS